MFDNRRRAALTAVIALAALAALTACSLPASDLSTNGAEINATDPAANPEGIAKEASAAPLPPAAPTDEPGGDAEVTEPSAPIEATEATKTSEPALDLGEAQTVTIGRVVDGDTVYTTDGAKIRLIGYDTPERGDDGEPNECGYDQATALVTKLVNGRTVTLFNPASVGDEDRYGRWLRYVSIDGQDLGAAVLEAGMAQARYDGLDGYDEHPLQDTYRAIDAQTANICG